MLLSDKKRRRVDGNPIVSPFVAAVSLRFWMAQEAKEDTIWNFQRPIEYRNTSGRMCRFTSRLICREYRVPEPPPSPAASVYGFCPALPWLVSIVDAVLKTHRKTVRGCIISFWPEDDLGLFSKAKCRYTHGGVGEGTITWTYHDNLRMFGIHSWHTAWPILFIGDDSCFIPE